MLKHQTQNVKTTMHELICYRDYVSEKPLSYWRSTSGFEVDFIIGDHTAIEVKAKQNLSPVDLKSLNALAEEKKLKRYLCVSIDPPRRRTRAHGYPGQREQGCERQNDCQLLRDHNDLLHHIGSVIFGKMCSTRPRVVVRIMSNPSSS